MALNEMLFCVLQASYQVQIGDGVIAQELDGGAPRYRRVTRGSYHSANVEWKVYPDGYQYLMAFYRVWARNPNKPFLIDLYADNAPVEKHQAFFSGAPSSTKQANIYTMTASLRIKPLVTNDAADDVIVGAGLDWANPLEKLVNEDFPNALGVKSD